MGTVSKEDIALALTEQADSRDKAFGTKSIVFAHKFTGGETSVDLLNLTTPPELLANGFVNADPSEIAAAHLSSFKKNVKLSLSRGPSGLELKQWAHYVVSGNQINFIGGLVNSGGAQAGEILFGEIVTVPSNSIVVGDMRWIRGTIPISIGQQLVPIPYPYKVGVNLSQGQAGDIKIKKQGVMLYRNVGNATASPSADGNFQEIDAGNGYGTSIMLNTPALTNFLLEYEVGFQLSSGDLSLWSALESFEGALLALAGDAAYNFYGDNNIARYIATSPSGLERRAFGDLLTASIARIAALEAPGPSLFVRRTANQVFTTSVSNEPMKFETIDEDSAGSYNPTTGLYTIPRSGRWAFFAHTASGSGQAWAAGQEWSNLFTLNGSYIGRIGSNYSQAAHSSIMMAPGPFYRRLVQGNTVSINIFHTRGSNTNQQNDANLNHFQAIWLGA